MFNLVASKEKWLGNMFDLKNNQGTFSYYDAQLSSTQCCDPVTQPAMLGLKGGIWGSMSHSLREGEEAWMDIGYKSHSFWQSSGEE